ncbi:DUF3899 domain-containing protein [Bacillus lacus]|uniref:DUF3899 domain-containing protein n=1 Tax=Metabacillus lacus TaxID=1983721 RepID=A0A7X2J199_9BACI|nr:DUF3899 domain-containing protein [Metabacillus lacus]MRX73608.1 DUF3899 domain-containing protein [Metabacillus lacus]
MKQTFILTGVSLAFTVVISLITYSEITLLSFINISFLISGALLLSGLLILVTQGGFFDAITHSFRSVFHTNSAVDKDDMERIRPLSELVSLEVSPIFLSGLLLAVLMLAGLFMYYQ